MMMSNRRCRNSVIRLSGRMVLVLNLLMATSEAVAQIGGVKIGKVSIRGNDCGTIDDTLVERQ